jgi:hypothetical protein
MSHAIATQAATATRSIALDAQGSRDAWGEALRWARRGREALNQLRLPLLRQGIDGLEVSDSSYEEWVLVRAQFDERVRSGAVPVI